MAIAAIKDKSKTKEEEKVVKIRPEKALAEKTKAENKVKEEKIKVEKAKPKPVYSTLLSRIATEADPVEKQKLIDECYDFSQPLTKEEEDLFNYVSDDYLVDNPGTTTAYIGKYYGENGELQ